MIAIDQLIAYRRWQDESADTPLLARLVQPRLEGSAERSAAGARD